MKPTLRQLEYAVAIQDLGSFSRAAERCHVTQPGLSTQVRKMERALGVELFERGSREVLVTPAGEVLLGRARSVLSAVNDLVRAVDDLRDPLEGTLRLGVIPTIAPYLLPQMMPAIRARFPKLRLLLMEERTRRLREMVEDGSLDLALVAVESDLGALETLPLFADRFVLAVSLGHRLARRQRVHPVDLEGEQVLLLEDGHCMREQTSVICEAAGAREVGDFRATSLPTLVHMVELGVGVTLLPELSVHGGRPLGARVALVRFARPEPARTVALAWRPTSPHREQYAALGRAMGAPDPYLRD